MRTTTPLTYNMSSSKSIPHLANIDKSQQLIVNGIPFLMLGAELQNSSMTSADYMDKVWQKLVDTNINTVLGCVTWEDIEPVEEKFDFSELDRVVEGARRHDLHLVLLWFGSFKNGEFSPLKVLTTFANHEQAFQHILPVG
jgi:GH35 family endo-1,4-beta-xylanase